MPTTISSGQTLYISDGRTSSGIIVESGGTLQILDGGVSVSATILNGGSAIVSSGGVFSDGVVSGLPGLGCVLEVLSGGKAVGTVVSNNALLQVSAGGAISETTLDADGFDDIGSGGSAVGTIVNSDGEEYVAGTASETTVNFGGYLEVASGGTAISGTVVSGGGTEVVFPGGATSGTVLTGFFLNLGYETVESGGVAKDTVVSGDGFEDVESGGAASGTAVTSGGILDVWPGGIASGTVVGSGGALESQFQASSGVTLSGIVLSGGSFDEVESGGTASGTVIGSGGFEDVLVGGTTVSATVDNGGDEYVGGTASGVTVESGGIEYVLADGIATDTTLSSGGTIDVVYLPHASGGSAIVNPVTDVLTVSDGGQVYTQQLSGDYAGDLFTLEDDGLGGTDIQIAPAGNTPIYPILTGSTWASNVGTAANVTYSFATSLPPDLGLTEFQPLSATDQDLVTQWLQNFAAVANITFTLVPDGGNADIMFGVSDDLPPGYAAATYAFSGAPLGVDNLKSFTGADTIYGDENITINEVLHELGNATGLRDFVGLTTASQEVALGLPPSGGNGTEFETVMGAFAGTNTVLPVSGPFVSGPTTPGLFDIAALQYLYGVNQAGFTPGAASTAGGLIYSFTNDTPYECIWVGNAVEGQTAFDFSACTGPVTIDLNQGTFSSTDVAAAGGPLGGTSYDNISIAYGTTIQKAIAGDGPTTIIGNNAGDTLIGGTGNDTFYVDGGTFLAGTGADTTVIGGGDDDTVVFHDPRADYRVATDSGGRLTVTETGGTQGDGTTTATGVAHLRFADATVTVGLSPVNDSGLRLTAGVTATIASSELEFSDGVGDPAQVTYTVTTPPAAGELLLGGAPTATFTQADIDNGLLSYRETTAGAPSDAFGFTVADAIGNTTAAQQFQIAIQPACYCAGTRILTLRGEVAVEAIAVGDRVKVLRDGGPQGEGFAPVTWLGYRHVACARHPRPWDVWPVRVRAEAFGPRRPQRDLLLSPDHAVFVAGRLVPIRYLINGATVVQEHVDSITYWHVELARHDVIFAEGLPCESYLDTDNRSAFANGGAVADLHPTFAPCVWETRACAPLVLEGPLLAQVRRRLLARAQRLGHDLTADPDLRVLLHSLALQPKVDGRVSRVRLPPGATTVRLASRQWVPGHVRPEESDMRTLGVALSRLWLDRREASLESPALIRGWYPPETGWRWTAGDADITVTGVRELAFELAMTGTYWVERRSKSVDIAAA